MFNLIIDDVMVDDIIDMLSCRNEWGEHVCYYYFQLDECRTLQDAINCAERYYKSSVKIEPAF